jgi:predicted transcriptional regulator
MATMLSLRLSDEQAKRVTALASRRGMTRSQWLRNAIEQQIVVADAVIDSHAVYLGLMADLAGMPGSGRRDGARQHSRVLKRQLNAIRRR